MSVTTYAELVTAIAAWVERASDAAYTGEVDTFIDMAEARMSRLLVGHHELEGSSTLTTDANGEVALPTDYLSYKTAIWDGSYDLPMDYVDWGTLQYLNPDNTSGVPCRFSIRNSTIKVGPIAEGDILLTYSGKVPALDDSNITNWLLTQAPDAYLLMCLSAGHLFNGDIKSAAAIRSEAVEMLSELGVVGDLGQFASAGSTLRISTP